MISLAEVKLFVFEWLCSPYHSGEGGRPMCRRNILLKLSLFLIVEGDRLSLIGLFFELFIQEKGLFYILMIVIVIVVIVVVVVGFVSISEIVFELLLLMMGMM